MKKVYSNTNEAIRISTDLIFKNSVEELEKDLYNIRNSSNNVFLKRNTLFSYGEHFYLLKKITVKKINYYIYNTCKYSVTTSKQTGKVKYYTHDYRYSDKNNLIIDFDFMENKINKLIRTRDYKNPQKNLDLLYQCGMELSEYIERFSKKLRNLEIEKVENVFIFVNGGSNEVDITFQNDQRYVARHEKGISASIGITCKNYMRRLYDEISLQKSRKYQYDLSK